MISFIVKIWIDEDDTWHGLVSSVPDGDRRYVIEPEEILAFITSHLAQLGVSISRRDNVRGKGSGDAGRT